MFSVDRYDMQSASDKFEFILEGFVFFIKEILNNASILNQSKTNENWIVIHIFYRGKHWVDMRNYMSSKIIIFRHIIIMKFS